MNAYFHFSTNKTIANAQQSTRRKYLENIQTKTGKYVAAFKKLAIAKGYFEKGKMKDAVKAAEVIAWLKKDFDLGYGHSLALYHAIKGDLK